MSSIYAAKGAFDWGQAWMSMGVILGGTLVAIFLGWLFSAFPRTGIVVIAAILLGGAFYLSGIS